MHLISSLLRTAPNFLCKRWRTRLLRWASLFLITHFHGLWIKRKPGCKSQTEVWKAHKMTMGERLRNIAHINTTRIIMYKRYFQSTRSAANCWRETQKKVQGGGRNKPHQTPNLLKAPKKHSTRSLHPSCFIARLGASPVALTAARTSSSAGVPLAWAAPWPRQGSTAVDASEIRREKKHRKDV